MQQFVFMRKDEGSPIRLGKVFTSPVEENVHLVESVLLTEKENEEMHLQELERGVSALLSRMDRTDASIVDLISRLDIMLNRIHGIEVKVAQNTNDIQEVYMSSEPISERA
jgi:hypothetical protein